MAASIDQRIISKMYEDYDNFRESLFDFKHPDPEVQKQLEQFIEILEIIKTQQIMRLSEREELKNTIKNDIEDNAPLIDIDAIKDSLKYMDLTEKIDLFHCRELAKYIEIIVFLLGSAPVVDSEIPQDANVPKMLTQLVFKYLKCEDEQEQEELKESMRELPDQEIVKKLTKKWGIEL